MALSVLQGRKPELRNITFQDRILVRLPQNFIDIVNVNVIDSLFFPSLTKKLANTSCAPLCAIMTSFILFKKPKRSLKILFPRFFCKNFQKLSNIVSLFNRDSIMVAGFNHSCFSSFFSNEKFDAKFVESFKTVSSEQVYLYS